MGICGFCNETISTLDRCTCKFCEEEFCINHIQLENHECRKITPVKYLRKRWLRKYGLNITTGKYKVVCDSCRYDSVMGEPIDMAGDKRKTHIDKNGCDEGKVFLEESSKIQTDFGV